MVAPIDAPWVLILAGGRGMRMKSFWNGLKCLYAIDGIPLIELIAARCVGCRIAINIHVEDVEALQSSPAFNDQWHLVIETERRGNAAAIAQFIDQYQPQRSFLVQHCDVISQTPAVVLWHQLKESPYPWTVLTLDRAPEKSWGILHLELDPPSGGGPTAVKGFTRKRWVNTGLYVIHPSIRSHRVFLDSPCDIDQHVFPALIATQELGASQLVGSWIDYGVMDTPAQAPSAELLSS